MSKSSASFLALSCVGFIASAPAYAADPVVADVTAADRAATVQDGKRQAERDEIIVNGRYEAAAAVVESPKATSALLDTCFRSTEYAGVLKGAKNPDGAKALIDFMNGASFQKSLPDSMYVFPVDLNVELPKAWAANAKQPTKPIEVSPADIDKNRSEWLTKWKDVTSK